MEFIIDCGANVGYSSVYLLTKYPTASLVAVEPDAGNFRVLQQNLAPFAGRAMPIRSGVWSHTCKLVMAEETYRDGMEWSRQVRECRPDEAPQMAAVDIDTLLRNSGFSKISILKMDIERAESVVFASNYESWLNRVDNIAIELHDRECSRVFFDAIAGRGFEISRSGELTVCKRTSSAEGCAGLIHISDPS